MVRIVLEDIKLNRNRDKKVFSKELNLDDNNKNTSIRKEEIIKHPFKNNTKDFFTKRQRIERTPSLKKKNKIIHNSTLILFIFSILIGTIYFGGKIFQKVEITISAKHQTINYKDKQFIALKDTHKDNINFTIMIYPETKMKKVILTDAEDVSTKAKGSVILYNEFTSTAQKIVAGTFLSDEEGKSYQLDEAITIPGYTLKDKKIIPGEIVANVSSFLPGDTYNGEPKNFYINAFKNTNKYNKIYGKLKSPFIGGASGLVYKLDDINKNKIEESIRSGLKNELLNKVKASVPPGYILYPEAMTFSYQIDETSYFKEPDSEVKIDEILSVILLKEDSLINNIAKLSLPGVSKEELKEITIPNLSKLSFNFIDKNQLITKDMESVSFTLSGDFDLVWKPEIEKIKSSLRGVHKDMVIPIFKNDPGVDSASVKVFPAWNKYLPSEIDKINIRLK